MVLHWPRNCFQALGSYFQHDRIHYASSWSYCTCGIYSVFYRGGLACGMVVIPDHDLLTDRISYILVVINRTIIQKIQSIKISCISLCRDNA